MICTEKDEDMETPTQESPNLMTRHSGPWWRQLAIAGALALAVMAGVSACASYPADGGPAGPFKSAPGLRPDPMWPGYSWR